MVCFSIADAIAVTAVVGADLQVTGLAHVHGVTGADSVQTHAVARAVHVRPAARTRVQSATAAQKSDGEVQS